jgi:hypothetical protein
LIIICFRFFRAQRGKSEKEMKKIAALPPVLSLPKGRQKTPTA